MSAEVESMFSGNRVTPWHGLGTIIEGTVKSEDAIKLAGLDWTVSKRKVYTDNGIEIPGWYANTRDTDGSVYGMTTGKYQVVQNSDAFSFVDNLIDSGDVRYETAGSLFGGKKVWMLAQLPSISVNDDKVESYLVITNSHDGKSAVRVSITPIRVCCQNTLSLALRTATRSWETRHTGRLDDKLESAKITLGFAETYNKELIKTADEMANTSINSIELNNILTKLFPVNDKDSERIIKNTYECRDEFIRCYNMDDIKKFKGTAWGVINAASDYFTHSTPQRATSTFAERRFDSIITGQNGINTTFNLIKELKTA